MFRRPRPLDFLIAALLIAAIVLLGWFFHIRDHFPTPIGVAAPDAGLVWICVSLDGAHSALAIAPSGEGTIRASDRAHAAYEVRMRLCDQPSAMTWTKAPAIETSISPPGGTSR